MKNQLAVATILVSILSGCALGPIYNPPQDQTPPHWHSAISTTMNSCEVDNFIWWERLQDPYLNQLIEIASLQNLDLQIAATRVFQARIEANGKKADLYPRIDGTVNAGDVFFSKEALTHGLWGAPKASNCQHFRRNVNYFEFGFDAQWEIDFFGMTKHNVAALKATEEAAQESLCAVWVTLSAEIAKNYIELRSLQARLGLIARQIELKDAIITLTQELLARGVINEMELYNAQAQRSTLQAESPILELEIKRAIHRLSVLLGLAPGELFECLEIALALPKLPEQMPIGIPSDLLRRRPDIRKAERELAAATARVGSAIAALFPRFSLNGFLGQISTNVGSLFKPSSTAFLAGPQLSIPIFNSSLLLQSVDYNKMATRESLFNYQKVVLEALEESENAICTYWHDCERFKNLSVAYDKYQQTNLLAHQLYQKGVLDNFKVIEATANLLKSEDTLLQSQTNLLIDYITLYKVLGGTWQ